MRLGLCLCLLLASCAAPGKPNFVPDPQDLAWQQNIIGWAPADTTLIKNVRVAPVKRLDVPPGWINWIDVKSALELTLQSAGLFSPYPGAKFVVTMEILQDAYTEGDPSVHTWKMRYLVQEGNSTYLDATYTTTSSVTRAEVPIQYMREKAAISRAVQNNFIKFMGTLMRQSPSAPLSSPAPSYSPPAPQPSPPAVIDPSAAVS